MSDGHGLAKMLMLQMSAENVGRANPFSGGEIAAMAYSHGEAFRALRKLKREEYATEKEVKDAEDALEKAQEHAKNVRASKGKEAKDEG